MTKLDDAKRSLLKAKQSAEERLQQLVVERREIKQSLRSLDAALRVLEKPKTGEKRSGPSASSDTGNSRAPTNEKGGTDGRAN